MDKTHINIVNQETVSEEEVGKKNISDLIDVMRNISNGETLGEKLHYWMA